jgi:hypothetical protein
MLLDILRLQRTSADHVAALHDFEQKQNRATPWGGVFEFWDIWPERLIVPEEEPEEQNMQESSGFFEIYIQRGWYIQKQSQRSRTESLHRNPLTNFERYMQSHW